MKDLLEGKVLEKRPADQPESLIRIVDVMPRCVPDDIDTADFAMVQAARVSYGIGTKKVNEDKGLIRHLLRNKHTTPFEMAEVKWHMKMPIATARQWIRHRTASVNEYSMRYSEAPDVKYIPELNNLRKQSKVNKQGSEGQIDESEAKAWLKELEDANIQCYKVYKSGIEKGIGKEQARYALNVNYYTEWYWKCDLWNTLNFLRLRMDHHAQQEIRVMADIMYELLLPLFPVTMEAFDDFMNTANVISLSRLDIEAMKIFINIKRKSNLEKVDANPETLDESWAKNEAYKVFGYNGEKKAPSEMTEFMVKMVKLGVF
jgi:thymidylate synthase (FAD)